MEITRRSRPASCNYTFGCFAYNTIIRLSSNTKSTRAAAAARKVHKTTTSSGNIATRLLSVFYLDYQEEKKSVEGNG
eukprot:scaffold5084_cov145-Skeletonema_menzelii.AAC.2